MAMYATRRTFIRLPARFATSGAIQNYSILVPSTMSDPINIAAVVVNPKEKVTVQQVAYTHPLPSWVVVNVKAVAINPVDGWRQAHNSMNRQHPDIVGFNYAGDVVEVGADVTDLYVGQKVFGQTSSTSIGPCAGSFQHYVCSPASCTVAMPKDFTYVETCVLPMGVVTAAAALFEPETMALPFPQVGSPRNGKVVLVWGAGTSVGISGVQLARSAGYDVMATASEANEDVVKMVGASFFNYQTDTVVEDIQTALGGKQLAGILCSVNDDQVQATCIKIAKLNGLDAVCGIWPFGNGMVDGIDWKGCSAGIVSKNGITTDVLKTFLPQALKTGEFIPLPKPEIIGHGLEYIQEGLDKVISGYMTSGSGARKIVVTL